MDKKFEHLVAFSTGMMSGKDGKELIEAHKDALEGLTPYDMLRLEDYQMQMGITVAEIKQGINKILNVLYEFLKEYEWERPAEGSFLYYLMLENRAYEFRLNIVKKIIRQYKGREQSDLAQFKEELLPHFELFAQFHPHYIKKENILFPFLERHWKEYKPLRVMWSLHDDQRRMIKELIEMAQNSEVDWPTFNRAIGNFYFGAFGMIHKEEYILYPVAVETIPQHEWEEMHRQSFEYHFPFIEAPVQRGATSEDNSLSAASNEIKSSAVGVESFLERAAMLFDHLPVDITYVDEENKVRFFNRPKDRFFPRSQAIIGRDVANCHPPESLHVVEQIIDSFRDGSKESAEFWINLRGRFIYIRYFAVKDNNNIYRGVLEVSQDVTDIRTLEGQRRLLDW